MVFWRGPQLDQALLELGKIIQVQRHSARHLAQFKTGQAVADVGGVRDFAHLAIAHYVHAGGRLFGHHVRHFGGHGGVEHRFVVVQAAVLRKQLGDDVFRARQAADVGGQNAMGHGVCFF